MWFFLGFAVSTALLGTGIVFGQTERSMGRLRPVVMDIEQDVPVIADVPVQTSEGVVTTTVPMTLNLALRVSLTSALTPVVTVKQTVPEVTVVDSGDEQVDDLGIPYVVEINSPDLTLTEWTTYVDVNGYFSIAGETTLAPDAVPIKGTRGQMRFYRKDGTLLSIREIPSVGFRLDVDGATRFESSYGLEPHEIDRYIVDLELLR
jgi:hypothetical protein